MASVAKCVAKRPLCMSGYVKRVASDLLAFQSAYSLWPPDSCASSKQRTQKEALDLFLIIIPQKAVDKINIMEQSTSSCRFPLCVPQIHWWWVLLKMTGEKSEESVSVWTRLSRPGQVSCHFISQELDSFYEVVLNSLVLSGTIDLQVFMIWHFYHRVTGEGHCMEDI